MTYLRAGTQVVWRDLRAGEAPNRFDVSISIPTIPRDSVPVYTEGSVNLAGNGFAILRDSTLRTYLYLIMEYWGASTGTRTGSRWDTTRGEETGSSTPERIVHVTRAPALYRRSIAHKRLSSIRPTRPGQNGYGEFFRRAPFVPGRIGRVDDRVSRRQTHANSPYRLAIIFWIFFDAGLPTFTRMDLPLHSSGLSRSTDWTWSAQPVDLFGHSPAYRDTISSPT